MSDEQWGQVELEKEVAEWLENLSDNHFGRVEFYIDLLAARGATLGEPCTRQLRELRYYLGSTGEAIRISYYIGSGRRIVLLTVFRKKRQRERAEVDRAHRAMERCIAQSRMGDGADG